MNGMTAIALLAVKLTTNSEPSENQSEPSSSLSSLLSVRRFESMKCTDKTDNKGDTKGWS